MQQKEEIYINLLSGLAQLAVKAIVDDLSLIRIFFEIVSLAFESIRKWFDSGIKNQHSGRN